MILELILVMAAAAAAILVVWIIIRRRNKHWEQIRRAAAILLKEKKLDQALTRMQQTNDQRYRTLLILSWTDTQKRTYIFDPEQGVHFGRSPVLNEVCIRDDKVSSSHCRMILAGGHLYLQDMNSANGTWIRSGLRTVRIYGDTILSNGSQLVLGGITFHVALQMFDMAYI